MAIFGGPTALGDGGVSDEDRHVSSAGMCFVLASDERLDSE